MNTVFFTVSKTFGLTHLKISMDKFKNNLVRTEEESSSLNLNLFRIYLKSSFGYL